MDDQVTTVLRLVPEFTGHTVAVTPLPGGITNRNYRVDVDGASYALRLSGDNTALLGIDRAVEVACSRAAAVCGIGPEVVASLPEHGALVTRFVDGQVLTPDNTRQSPMLRRIAHALRRYHDGPPVPGHFSPFETVRRYHALALERGVRFPPALDRAL